MKAMTNFLILSLPLGLLVFASSTMHRVTSKTREVETAFLFGPARSTVTVYNPAAVRAAFLRIYSSCCFRIGRSKRDIVDRWRKDRNQSRNLSRNENNNQSNHRRSAESSDVPYSEKSHKYEAGTVALYVAAQVVYIVTATSRKAKSDSSASDVLMYVANSFGILSFYDMSLFLVPVSKFKHLLNAVDVDDRIGVSIHKALGYTSILAAFLHGFLHTVRYVAYESSPDLSAWRWAVFFPSECWNYNGSGDWDCDDCR